MPKEMLSAMEQEACRILEDCTYSAKGHFESAREWGKWNLLLGIPSVVLAAAAGVSGFNDSPLLAGGLAVFGGALAGVLTFLKPTERASSHNAAGTLYNSLKNRTRFFTEVDLLAEAPVSELQDQLRQLAAERNALGEASPQILRKAFEQARAGIECGEATYSTDVAR